MKSKAAAERKMKERVATAGSFLKEGMTEAVDPLDVLSKDPEGYAKKLQDGLADSIRRGKWQGGIKTAKTRNAYKTSVDRAGAHFEERAEDMVSHAMEDYDVRVKCIEEAKRGIDAMPKASRAQRIARAAKYQELMGVCMDKAKGRKG